MLNRRNTLLANSLNNNSSGGEYIIDIDNYLTIEALEDGLTATFYGADYEYCIDGDGVWYTLYDGEETPSINQGQIISFKGNLTPDDGSSIGNFEIYYLCNLKGNCMSMLFGDDAANHYSLEGYDYAFNFLFANCSIVEVSPNFLPATTLAGGCYQGMFDGCTSLTTAPELPATTLAEYCYSHMFGDCTSLTTAPKLPATTLAGSCYYGMFTGCTSLTTVSELPATTLTDDCYSYMFSNCTSLTTAPKLPATTLAISCYDSMFYGCTSLTTAPSILPATTLAEYCYQYMFYGCTSLTTAPELPAITLTDYCYCHMFNSCSKLNYIKAMFTTKPNISYTYYWVYRVASTGTFIKNKNATWDVTGTDGVPSGWTVQTA